MNSNGGAPEETFAAAYLLHRGFSCGAVRVACRKTRRKAVGKRPRRAAGRGTLSRGYSREKERERDTALIMVIALFELHTAGKSMFRWNRRQLMSRGGFLTDTVKTPSTLTSVREETGGGFLTRVSTTVDN